MRDEERLLREMLDYGIRRLKRTRRLRGGVKRLMRRSDRDNLQSQPGQDSPEVLWAEMFRGGL